MAALPLGQRLIAFRKIKNLTQEELAELCGVSVTSISRWENGNLRPKPKHLKKLAEVLGTDEATFFHSSELVIPDNVVIKEFISILQSLNHEEQLFALNCLKEYQNLRKGHSSRTD